MKQLILMRHGRSLLNDGHKSSERDNVLAWRGVLNTMAEAEPLKSAGIARVLSSPIPRAYQTAMLAVSAIGQGIPISLHPEIEELRGNDRNSFALTVYEDDASSKAWKNEIDKTPSWGTESQAQVYARATQFLKDALPEALKLGSVMIVSHYFTMRGIRAFIEHGNPKHMPEFRPRNSVPVAYSAEDVLKRISGDVANDRAIKPIRRD